MEPDTDENEIHIFRAIHNITQEELVKKISVTRKTINSIERGKYYPSIDIAYRMAILFNVTIEERFNFDEEENENNL